MKEDVLSFQKMWYFLGVAVFKGELLAVKVLHCRWIFPQKIEVNFLTEKKTKTGGGEGGLVKDQTFSEFF